MARSRARYGKAKIGLKLSSCGFIPLSENFRVHPFFVSLFLPHFGTQFPSCCAGMRQHAIEECAIPVSYPAPRHASCKSRSIELMWKKMIPALDNRQAFQRDCRGCLCVELASCLHI